MVTVGEKIGKEHLTYAQGACAELVAMATIFAADNFGPAGFDHAHVLSSGVAGTMAANGSGLQLSTMRNIAAAWVFTLPVAALLSGTLYFLFRHIRAASAEHCATLDLGVHLRNQGVRRRRTPSFVCACSRCADRYPS